MFLTLIETNKSLTSRSRDVTHRNLYGAPTMASGPRFQSLGTTNFLFKRRLNYQPQDVDICPDQKVIKQKYLPFPFIFWNKISLSTIPPSSSQLLPFINPYEFQNFFKNT